MRVREERNASNYASAVQDIPWDERRCSVGARRHASSPSFFTFDCTTNSKCKIIPFPSLLIQSFWINHNRACPVRQFVPRRSRIHVLLPIWHERGPHCQLPTEKRGYFVVFDAMVCGCRIMTYICFLLFVPAFNPSLQQRRGCSSPFRMYTRLIFVVSPLPSATRLLPSLPPALDTLLNNRNLQPPPFWNSHTQRLAFRSTRTRSSPRRPQLPLSKTPTSTQHPEDKQASASLPPLTWAA